MKKKILFYGDSPSVATGFGTVSRNILDILYKTGKYTIDIFGINYHGLPTPLQKIYNMWPAADPNTGDPYGRKKFCYHALAAKFDILFIIQDTFIIDFVPELITHLQKQVDSGERTPFRTIIYYPTDSVIKPKWFYHLSFADKLISYTNFGVEATKEGAEGLRNLWKDSPNVERVNFELLDNIDVIYHGINSQDFFPLPQKEILSFKQHYFGRHADKFIFMNANRNQQRKDIPRTIKAFKEFKKQRPNSILYLHMAKKDQGWDLEEVCRALGVSLDDDVVFPENFEPNQAYPREVLNMLYNCCDCGVSTTLSEGFGLQWIELMACKKPVIMPNNTAMKELITDDKGYLVNCGGESLWVAMPNDNDVIRPLVDVEDMVVKMLHVYDNYEEAQTKANNAFTWVLQNFEWTGKIAKQWRKVFDEEVRALNKVNPNKDIGDSSTIITTKEI